MTSAAGSIGRRYCATLLVRDDVLQISSGKPRFVLDLDLGQAEGVDAIVGELDEEKCARDSGENGGGTGGETPKLVELDGGREAEFRGELLRGDFEGSQRFAGT